MNFADFFVFHRKMGMFFVVQFGALAATAVLCVYLRNLTQKVVREGRTEVEDRFPTFLMLATVALLIAASFLPEKPAVTNGLICTGLFLLGVTRQCVREKSGRPLFAALRQLDCQTLLLLAGLFVVIAGVREAGVIDAIAQLIAGVGGGSVFAVYSLIVWGSVILSAFIDNIPYVAAMLPVAANIAQIMGVEPYLLYFGLLTGATLGGNLTPIGASANITGIGILRKKGYAVKTGDFMKIGVPFTLCAVTVGYVLLWLLWA